MTANPSQSKSITPAPKRSAKAWYKPWAAIPVPINGRSLRPSVRSIRSVVEAEQSRLTQMAAALSYRTIFGMIPVLVVSLVALKAFTTPAQIESLLGQAMRLAGLDKIAVDGADMPMLGIEPSSDTAMGPPLPDLAVAPPTTIDVKPPTGLDPGLPVPNQEARPVTSDAANSANTGSQRLDQWIQTTAMSFDKFSLSAIGYAGIAMLIYAAVSMLVEIEHSFNQIFRVPTGRSWIRRITHYWTLLTLGTVLLAATFVVGQRFEQWMTEFTQTGRFVGADKISVNAIAFLTTVAISTMLFLLAYTVIPNTRVKLRPALAGALVAAILWETGKWAFSKYLSYSTSYQKFYGSIALIPLFLLWIYAAWMIVLFGLYVTYQLQHVRTRTVAQPVDAAEPAIIDPGSILSVMGGLATEFQTGKSVDSRSLAKKLGLYEPAVTQMLGRLAEAGLVHRIQKGENRDDEFALARPPQSIDAEQVLRLGEDLAGLSDESVGSGVAKTLRDGRLASIRGKTLANLLPDEPPRVAPPLAAEVAETNPNSAATETRPEATTDVPAAPRVTDLPLNGHVAEVESSPSNKRPTIDLPFRAGPKRA